MNTGVTATRYARALLSFVTEAGTGEKVYSQACVIVHRMEELSQLREYILRHDEISSEKKVEVLSAALEEPLSDDLVKFLELVKENRRMEFFYRMLWSFISQYREAKGIKVGDLTTALEQDGLRERLEALFHDRTGFEVHFQTHVDPEILGGFVFELDGRRLDASVRSQLDRISRELVGSKGRLV